MASEPTHSKDETTAPTSREVAIFAYGTLKAGFENHAYVCRGATSNRQAWAWGALHLLTQNVPTLDVPRDRILLRGTDDFAADAAAAEQYAGPDAPALTMEPDAESPWRRITGQLLTFPDGERRLRILDAFEGVRPRTTASYQRVMIPVFTEGSEWQDAEVEAAWVYVIPEDAEPPGEALDMDGWETQP